MNNNELVQFALFTCFFMLVTAAPTLYGGDN